MFLLIQNDQNCQQKYQIPRFLIFTALAEDRAELAKIWIMDMPTTDERILKMYYSKALRSLIILLAFQDNPFVNLKETGKT